jgi:hypothetical protein
MAAAGVVIRPSEMVFPLSSDQNQLYLFFTSNSLVQRLKRDLYFITSRDSVWVDFRNKSVTGSAFGAIAGGFFSYWLAGYLKNESESTSRDGKATLKITSVGAGLGATLGGLFGAGYTINQVEQSKEYLTWRDNAILTGIYPLFKKFLNETEQFQDLLCPINHDLISVPFKDPKGRVYEEAEIRKWIRKVIPYSHEALAKLPSDSDRDGIRFRTSPFGDMELTEADLTYDFDYHRKVAVALKALFDQQIQVEVRQGLLQYRLAMFHDRESLMREILSSLAAKHILGTISEHEFLEACKECKRHYGLPG